MLIEKKRRTSKLPTWIQSWGVIVSMATCMITIHHQLAAHKHNFPSFINLCLLINLYLPPHSQLITDWMPEGELAAAAAAGIDNPLDTEIGVAVEFEDEDDDGGDERDEVVNASDDGSEEGADDVMNGEVGRRGLHDRRSGGSVNEGYLLAGQCAGDVLL